MTAAVASAVAAPCAWLSMAPTPLLPAVVDRAVPVPVGTPIARIVPPQTAGAMVRVDGQWVLREQWGHELQAGQHLEVHIIPAGGGEGRKALRLALQIAAAVALGPQGLGLEGAAYAVANLAASAAINALLPLRLNAGQFGGQAGSPAYTVALGGNRAALYEPVPVGYGRMRHFPPFGADPYSEFDSANDQYYHALLCVGMGAYDIEAIELDDTALGSFEDVQFAILPPGTAPTLVLPNVVTSPEVGNLPLNPGRASPEIAACRGGLTASAVGFDIVFEGGLGDASGAGVANKSVTVRFDVRSIDDWGVPLTAWTTLATEVITAASTSPVRRSFKYTLGTAARVQARVIRVTPRDDDPLVPNDANWAGLRAYLSGAAPLASGATYIEVKMRATEQLTALSQRRLAVIQRRKVHTWSSGAGWSASPVFTRNPAWIILDKLRSAEYGDGLPDSRLDLASFAAYATTWDARQDRLDIIFDALTDSDEADQIMARAGRARCFWRNGVRTITRDEAQTVPAAAFSGRDMVPGSASLALDTDAARTPDGIQVEYFSHRTWDWAAVMCPAPGVVTPTRPEVLRLIGVSGAKQAEREGLYEAAARALRRKRMQFTTELQGLLPAYGSQIVASLPLRGWGQHGDITGWDGTTLTAAEPLAWVVAATHYVTLVRPDGSVHPAVEVVQGGSVFEAVPQTALDFTPETSGHLRERTRFVFGTLAAGDHRRTALVTAIRPVEMTDDGAMLVRIEGINDPAEVHTADNALLPGPGEVQDPIDSPNFGVPPGGGAIVPYLAGHSDAMSLPAGAGQTQALSVRLNDDGTLDTIRVLDGVDTATLRADEWVLGTTITPAEAADFEVRATLTVYTTSGSGAASGDSLGVWLALGVDRRFTYGIPAGDGQNDVVRLRLQIREASSGIEQAAANHEWTLTTADFGE